MKRRRKAAGSVATDAAPSAPPPKRKKKRQRTAAKAEAAPEDIGQQEPQGDEAALGEDAMDIDFDFCDPSEEDYHPVAELLKSGTWDFVKRLAYPELVDAVVGQGNIGTLIKSDAGGEDEAVCGLLTVLNLRQFSALAWPGAVGEALAARAAKHAPAAAEEALRALLERRGEHREVGLLLSERFANLPPELLHPLHAALLEDIEWSCSTPECPAEERPFYRFTHFLGVARCRAAPGGRAPGARPGGRARRGGAADAGPLGDAVHFARPEDEVLVRRAAFAFAFPMPASTARSSSDDADDGRPADMRAVFGISRADFGRAVAELRGALGTGE